MFMTMTNATNIFCAGSWRGERRLINRYALVWIACFLSVGPSIADVSYPAAITDAAYAPIDPAEALLGRDLFYDPILSGNKTVACATCHHPTLGTADGVSLSIGDGGIGLGPKRTIDPDDPPEKRIPRNAPGLFNLGASEFTVMFHDGRLEASPDHPGGMRTPMDADMLAGFASVLSAQTMFPVLSRDEMAGSFRENEVARAVRSGRITGDGGAWDLLSRRVGDVPAYAAAFRAVYPHIEDAGDIAFTDISNAIAVFMAFEWRSDTSPFDAFLRGSGSLAPQETRGAALFFGSAGCSVCHSGAFQTDHRFHAMAVPQIGPGKAADFEDHNRDEGRFRVTGNSADLYAFRTPSLRNVALTAPYGHAGAQPGLVSFVAAHADPANTLADYDPAQAILAEPTVDDFAVMQDPAQVAAIAGAVSAAPVDLSPQDVADIVAFLNTLTDPVAKSGRLGVPNAVPSGLPVP
ncbi:MAG: cytochrome c peroxidase [Sulfitobacter sp.]